MLCSKLCFVENLKPRPRKRAMLSRGSTRSIEFKSHPDGWAKDTNTREGSLSSAVTLIVPVVFGFGVSGCGGMLNGLLPSGVADPSGIAVQGNLPSKVALYGPEGVGPYQEFQCSIESPISVICDFSGFLQNRTPDRTFFGLIFPEGWGYIVGANGPRSGALEVVDGNAHGF